VFIFYDYLKMLSETQIIPGVQSAGWLDIHFTVGTLRTLLKAQITYFQGFKYNALKKIYMTYVVDLNKI
jgi:hypothetical protein